MITIQGKTVGKKGDAFESWRIPMEPSLLVNGTISLGSLISAIVESELEAFFARQAKLKTLFFLSPEEIRAGAEEGRILMGGREFDTAATSLALAQAEALTAFEDGIYFVLVDGRRMNALDETVTLSDESTVMFVKLTMLAGG